MPAPASLRRDFSLVLQFGAMALVWGASFLFMKLALTGVSWTQIGWSRAILGALVLGVILLVRREKLPREPIVYVHFTVIALTNAVLPHLAFAWGEQYTSSSLAAIYNAVTPIATAVMVAVVFRAEKLTRGQTAGVVLGLAGVVVIIAPWQAGALTGELGGQLACLGAAISYGFAIAYTRRFVSGRPIQGVTVAFLNVGTAGVIMLALTPVLAVGPVRLDVWIVGSLLLLGGLGTGVAYVWSINVLRAWGPTTQSTVTYLIPVVGVALGVLLLGERLTWYQPIGAAIVLTSILLTQRRLRRRAAVRTIAESEIEAAEGPVKLPRTPGQPQARVDV